MEPTVVAALTAVAISLGALVGLTALGQRRRGHSWGVAVIAGLFFPITWAVWYVRDEQPYRRLACR